MTSIVLPALALGSGKIQKDHVAPIDVSNPWEAVQLHV